MEGSAEKSIDNSELSTIAPGIPEGLERLGHFNTYSIESSPDGTSATVNRLRKMGDQHNSGYRVVDQQRLTAEDIEKSEKWISQAFDSVLPGKVSPQQLHQLDIVDEIVQIISADFKAAQKAKSPGGEPSL